MYRVNQKRKFCVMNNDDEVKDKLAETFMEGFEKMLGGDKKKHKKMGNIFNQRNTNEEIYRENNHIYFRTDVTIDNCDILLQLVREFEEDMKMYTGDRCKTFTFDCTGHWSNPTTTFNSWCITDRTYKI